MKKIFVLLAALLMLSFSGCNAADSSIVGGEQYLNQRKQC